MPNALPNECEGKKPYYDRQQAIKAATAYSLKSGQRLRAYKCHECGHIHIGHQSKKVKMKPVAIRVLKMKK